MFDRSIYADTLNSAGIWEDQARAHASTLQIALTDSVATNDDVAFLRHDVECCRKDVEGLRRDVGKCETMTNADRREAALRGDMATIRAEMAGQKVELIR